MSLDVCEWRTLETAVRLDDSWIFLFCQDAHELIRELLSDCAVASIFRYVVQVMWIYPQVVEFLCGKLSKSYLE